MTAERCPDAAFCIMIVCSTRGVNATRTQERMLCGWVKYPSFLRAGSIDVWQVDLGTHFLFMCWTPWVWVHPRECNPRRGQQGPTHLGSGRRSERWIGDVTAMST